MGAQSVEGVLEPRHADGPFPLEQPLSPWPHGALAGHWPSSVGVPGSWLAEPGWGQQEGLSQAARDSQEGLALINHLSGAQHS